LAFRTGSRAKQRIHIFWQRRVRDNDDVTPYWFPAKTQAGAVGEDRIVLPIPPGTHWRDAKPTILPGLPALPPDQGLEKAEPLLLPGGAPVKARPEKPVLTKSQRAAIARSQSAHLGASPLGKKAVIRGGRIRYVDIPGFDPSLDGPDELREPEKVKKPRAPRMKNDPKYVAAARELRDRYLEQFNTPGMQLPPATNGKYDVSRALEAMPTELKPTPLLKAA
jgi:hypothetical protein